MSSAGLKLRLVSSAEGPVQSVCGLTWVLGVGAFGLAWSITTVAAYVPAVLEEYTPSTTLIGLVLAAEGLFAIFVPLLIGPMSDATQTELGRRRPWRFSVSSSPITFTSRRTEGCIPTFCPTRSTVAPRASSTSSAARRSGVRS